MTWAKVLSTLAWVLPSVIIVAVAQIFLKVGMIKIGSVGFSTEGIVAFLAAIIRNPSIWIGMSLFFISMLWWLIVLSKLDVSVAYPLVSLGYVVSVGAAYFMFGEPLTLNKVLGLVFIITGVYCIARS